MAVYMCFPGGKKKTLTFSYDDGQIHDKRLVSIFNQHGLKGTFNLNAGTTMPEEAERETQDGKMKWSEMVALFRNSGHEVAIHTYTHPWIKGLKTAEAVSEILEDRKVLEEKMDCIVRGSAYPFGCYNDDVIDALRLCGIVYARTTKATECFDLPENWLTLHPTCHHKNPRLMELAKQFLEGVPRWGNLWMFYVWGHSYEFHRENNWELIENFASYIGGKEDVWYATNIEIYDYIKAYEQMQMSVDAKRFYNPTAIPLWFEKDGQTYEVGAGERLCLS